MALISIILMQSNQFFTVSFLILLVFKYLQSPLKRIFSLMPGRSFQGLLHKRHVVTTQSLFFFFSGVARPFSAHPFQDQTVKNHHSNPNVFKVYCATRFLQCIDSEVEIGIS